LIIKEVYPMCPRVNTTVYWAIMFDPIDFLGIDEEIRLVHVIICESVKDYAKWLKTFNNDAPIRKGSRGSEILKLENDPNKHYAIFKWSDDETHDFADFAKTVEMQRVFKEACVLEQTIQICSPSTIINK
jgi:hypothetical protein